MRTKSTRSWSKADSKQDLGYSRFYQEPVKHVAVSADGVKIGDVLPPVTKAKFKSWRNVVSADGLRKIAGVFCHECSEKAHPCTYAILVRD